MGKSLGRAGLGGYEEFSIVLNELMLPVRYIDGLAKQSVKK